MRPRALLICGTLNQTKMMEKIGGELAPEFDCWFTPFYGDGVVDVMARQGLLNFTAIGGPLRRRTHGYLRRAGVQIDDRGPRHDYDLIVTCTDLVIQSNIRGKPIVLVQEGIMEPANLQLGLVQSVGLPRHFANTAATGLSDAYDGFCVASEGYRELFIERGVRPQRLAVTGIPNFEEAEQCKDNEFPCGTTCSSPPPMPGRRSNGTIGPASCAAPWRLPPADRSSSNCTLPRTDAGPSRKSGSSLRRLPSSPKGTSTP